MIFSPYFHPPYFLKSKSHCEPNNSTIYLWSNGLTWILGEIFDTLEKNKNVNTSTSNAHPIIGLGINSRKGGHIQLSVDLGPLLKL
jgi:hypothetical protein